MTNYIGRFAPSPSGPLHFGSLVAALGSYFQAKSQQGQWLVRIEDLDPPREMPGAGDLILKTLDAYGLHWDQTVWYQSQRHTRYQDQIQTWLNEGAAYYCQCTRKQIKAMGGYYSGRCRQQQLPCSTTHAIRLHVTHPVYSFQDQKHGQINIPAALAEEDFIMKRRDGLFAYNLAVVLDDIDQQVTEVVRGADLIEPTGRQISLYRQLNHPEVTYLHLPLATADNGNKLSKQNHAPAISLENPRPTLLAAMAFLGFKISSEMHTASLSEIVAWGTQNWHIRQIPDTLAITL